MRIEILLFGILRDVVGENKLNKEVTSAITLENLRRDLLDSYPDLQQYKNYSIAINEVYAENTHQIKENDVVALIPPVSGG